MTGEGGMVECLSEKEGLVHQESIAISAKFDFTIAFGFNLDVGLCREGCGRRTANYIVFIL